MNKKRYLPLILITLILSSCTQNQNNDIQKQSQTVEIKESVEQVQTEEIDPNAKATGIDTETLKTLLDNGDNITIIDLRSPQEYEMGHIKGAVLVEEEYLEGLLNQGLSNKEQTIILYGNEEEKVGEVSDRLAQLGYVNVKNFGNIANWAYELVTTQEENIQETEDLGPGVG